MMKMPLQYRVTGPLLARVLLKLAGLSSPAVTSEP